MEKLKLNAILITILFIPLEPALGTGTKIGGLFDISDIYTEMAFRNGADLSKLTPQLETLPPGDSFHASKKACQLLKDGVGGLIGPQSHSSSSLIQSLCDVMEVPHIETTWNSRQTPSNFLLNLYPHPDTLTQAFADIIEVWGWKSYFILYENNDSLFHLRDILKASNPSNRQATLKQLPGGDDYRPLFKEIRLQTDINTLIIDCDVSKLPLIFDHANQVGMIKNYRYFITSLDIDSIDMDTYLFGDMNITAFRLVDRDNPKVAPILRQWQRLSQDPLTIAKGKQRPHVAQPKTKTEPFPPLPRGMMTTQMALIYDALSLLSKGLEDLNASENGPLEIPSLECNPSDPGDPWKQGQFLMENLKKTQFEGLSGTIQFDEGGYRTNFKLDVMELTQKGLSKIGVWEGGNFDWMRSQTETLKLQEEDLKNKTLIVCTKQSDPYFIVNNGTYEGYAIDLLDLLTETLHFKYEMKEAADNSYGAMSNKSKYGWTGVMGEILAGIADVGIGDMTITHDREKTLDFTMPFMNLGISILYTIPEKKIPPLFSFLEPFNFEVWIYMSTAYLGVSLIMFVLARFSPDEWQDAPPCSKDSGVILENQFSMVNSLWFAIGSLMAQGCDILPKGTSTRTVAGFWWFFNLIIISSYTANLAAFLTSEGMEGGVKSIADLPKQTKVKYGSIGSGSTFGFFKGSSFPLYKEIFQNMQNMRPSPYVSSNKEGVDRVRKSGGKYAFFMESSSIEFQTERDCKLTQLGAPLDSKGYGIALRKNSKYKDAFNNRILDLQEKGELEKLKVKWWGEEKGGGKCEANKAISSGGPQPLNFGNVGGVFVSLLLGWGIAFVMAAFEFFWKARKLGRKKGESYWREMGKHLRFALLCQGETKPVRKDDDNDKEGESVPYLALDGKQVE